MRSLITLLTLLFSFTALAGPAQVNSIITLTDQLGNSILVIPESSWSGGAGGTPTYKTIVCGTTAGTATDFYQCHDLGGGTNNQYQVPNGKTFKVLRVCGESSSGGVAYQLAQSTATFTNAAASITGGIYDGGAAGVYLWLVNASSSTYSCFVPIGMMWQQNNYPAIQIGSGAGSTVYNVLVTGKVE